MLARRLAGLLAGLCLVGAAARAGVDAPELAAPGPFTVGVADLTFTQAAQPDVLAYDVKTRTLPRRNRILPTDVWYPAQAAPRATAVTYAGALVGEDGREVAFTVPGAAIRDAPPRFGHFPLVILAHGYGGTPVAMSWLAENLASKGYVVVGPHFNDPPITDGAKFAGPLARRPLDIAFVAAEAQARAGRGAGPLAGVDPSRTVLIGYSMGGYGVLTAAGAALAPDLAAATRGALANYVRGAEKAATLKVAHVVAVVAISPASRLGAGQAWGADGLGAVTLPTLFIGGDQDKVVGYDPGVKTLFAQEIHAPRYLLTFQNAGHAIGMNGAPEAMRRRLWDKDWFEDPVWRKERLIGVELHFITAFLDRYAKGDAAKAAFLNVAEPVSNRTSWPADGARYDAPSPGKAPVTVWRGFQRDHIAGLELRFAPPAP